MQNVLQFGIGLASNRSFDRAQITEFSTVIIKCVNRLLPVWRVSFDNGLELMSIHHNLD